MSRSLGRSLLGALSVLAGSSCGSDPSSQKITVQIDAPDVTSVHLVVRRDDQITPLVDCHLAALAMDGQCPFDMPKASWAPGEPLAFVVYGQPSTKIEIAAEGLDALGEVITATTSEQILPAIGRSTPPPMVLYPRTVARRSCAVDVLQDVTVAESQRDRTAIFPADIDGDGTLELVVGTPRRISIYRWSKLGHSGCELVETATVSIDCTPRGGSLVLGEMNAGHDGLELAGLCLSRSATNKNRMAMWGLEIDKPASLIGELEIVAATGQVTRPVLADLDGDGTQDLTYLIVTSTTGPVVSLATWRPGEIAPRTVAINGLRLAAPTTNLTLSPVILTDGSGRDSAIIEGYRGGVFQVSSAGVAQLESTNSAPPGSFSGALVSRPDLPPRALFVRDQTDGTAIFDTAIMAHTKSGARILAEKQRIPGLTTIAVAVGDVDGNGEPSAVLAADGFIQILPLTTTTAPARRFALGETVDGAMVVLLADIDGAPGAEIIAFQPKVGRIHALDGAGRIVPGFPISLGVPGPETRVFVADLDGDGALELVSISYDRVGVTSLGPYTSRPAATPWPLAYRDGGGRAASLSEHW